MVFHIVKAAKKEVLPAFSLLQPLTRLLHFSCGYCFCLGSCIFMNFLPAAALSNQVAYPVKDLYIHWIALAVSLWCQVLLVVTLVSSPIRRPSTGDRVGSGAAVHWMKIPFVSSVRGCSTENPISTWCHQQQCTVSIHQKPINSICSPKKRMGKWNRLWYPRCEFWVTKMPETLVKDPTAKSIKTF